MNLVQHRGETSVWDNAGNGWDIERWLAAGIGGAALVSGLRRRSVAGFLLVAAGGALAWWAASGTEQRRHHRGRLQEWWPGRTGSADLIREASEESFPASDAPAWTQSTGNTGPVGPAVHRGH